MDSTEKVPIKAGQPPVSQSPLKTPGDLSARFHLIFPSLLCAYAESHHEHTYFLGMQDWSLILCMGTCGLGIDQRGLYWETFWLWFCCNQHGSFVYNKKDLAWGQVCNLWWPSGNYSICICKPLNVTKFYWIADSVNSCSTATKMLA